MKRVHRINRPYTGETFGLLLAVIVGPWLIAIPLGLAIPAAAPAALVAGYAAGFTGYFRYRAQLGVSEEAMFFKSPDNRSQLITVPWTTIAEVQVKRSGDSVEVGVRERGRKGDTDSGEAPLRHVTVVSLSDYERKRFDDRLRTCSFPYRVSISKVTQ